MILGWNVFGTRAIVTMVLIAVVSYLIGSINSSIILSRAISGRDIRESGSGNAGATNMLRTHGKKMGVLTLLIDVAKGIIAVLLAVLVVKYYNSGLAYKVWGRSDLNTWQGILDWISLPYIAGLFVILGHNFPLYFGFKGGKGVATSLGVVMMLDWKIGVMILVIALIIMAVTRYVSLGSVISGILFIILEIARMFFDSDWNLVRLICVILIGGLIIVRHHANIKRLLNGTENKLGAKKKD